MVQGRRLQEKRPGVSLQNFKGKTVFIWQCSCVSILASVEGWASKLEGRMEFYRLLALLPRATYHLTLLPSVSHMLVRIQYGKKCRSDCCHIDKHNLHICDKMIVYTEVTGLSRS
jgi:hypothetical protein